MAVAVAVALSVCAVAVALFVFACAVVRTRSLLRHNKYSALYYCIALNNIANCSHFYYALSIYARSKTESYQGLRVIATIF